MAHEVKNVLALQAELGECPLWSTEEQVLWCVDILAPAIHRYDPASGELQTFPQQEEVGCIGLREQGGLIAALRSGVWLLDAQGKPQQKVADNPGEAALMMVESIPGITSGVAACGNRRTKTAACYAGSHRN